MKFQNHIAALAFVFSLFHANAQENELQKTLETLMESRLEEMEEGSNSFQLAEELQKLAENPVNINTATHEQLSGIYFLNEIQIKKLQEYVRNYGPVYSIYELNTIDGFTPELLTAISPLIWFGPKETKPPKPSEIFSTARSELFLRALTTIPKAKGFIEKEDGSIPFEGNPFRYYTKFRIENPDYFSAGFTAEKDPGEAFFSHSNKNGFDFYSGHISIKTKTFFRNLIAGDFMVNTGQGLLLWQGYSTGKSAYTLDIAKSGQGIRPYTSADENRFFRGVATTFALKNASLSLFYSSKKTDANTESDDTGNIWFTSLQTSGYHRTESEILDKNSIRHATTGVLFSCSFSNLKIGATLLYDRFEKPFLPAEQLYNVFRFRGTENFAGAANYQYFKGKYQIFGEAAISESKGKAVINGAIAHLHDRVQVSAIARRFDKNFHTFWGSPFAEGSSTINESGIFFGTKILPVKFVTFSAYADFYKSDWISYTTAGPSNGRDFLAETQVRLLPKTEFYIRFKTEEKEQKTLVDKRYVNSPERTTRTRFQFEYSPNEMLSLKTRIELSQLRNQASENGFMVFQDIQFHPENFPLSVSSRIAWVNTDSYQTAIYAYENDLLYTFSIPAYYGKGIRSYLNFRCRIGPRADLWFKIANTAWIDRETIGSGLSEINSNHKTELKFQLRLKI